MSNLEECKAKLEGFTDEQLVWVSCVLTQLSSHPDSIVKIAVDIERKLLQESADPTERLLGAQEPAGKYLEGKYVLPADFDSEEDKSYDRFS